MKETVNETRFVTRFADIGRKDNFSLDARRALFAYYEQLEEDAGEEINFDPIAICCDWGEYESANEWAIDYYTYNQYKSIIDGILPEDIEEHLMEGVRDQTQVIEFDGGILVMAF